MEDLAAMTGNNVERESRATDEEGRLIENRITQRAALANEETLVDGADTDFDSHGEEQNLTGFQRTTFPVGADRQQFERAQSREIPVEPLELDQDVSGEQNNEDSRNPLESCCRYWDKKCFILSMACGVVTFLLFPYLPVPLPFLSCNGHSIVMKRRSMQTNNLPSCIGRLKQLTRLQVNYPDSFFTIPTELGRLTSLTYLRVYSKGKLEGTIPTELGMLTALEDLGLSCGHWEWIGKNCPLGGTIPTELELLTALTSLGLASNELVGTIPNWLTLRLPPYWLDLNDNHLTGTIGSKTFCAGYSVRDTRASYEAVTSISTIRSLHFTLPSCLGLLTELTSLALSGEQLKGTIPTELGLLTQLTQLILSSNNLTGPIPTELGRLTELTGLSLYNNGLVDTIPSELGLLTSAQSLTLENNKLTGQIPSELRNVSRLWKLELDLRNNLLTGTIPTWLNQTGKWDVTGNDFTVPPCDGYCCGYYVNSSSVTSFSENTRRYALPTCVGQLTWMTNLVLFHGEDLSGTIPTEVGLLTRLTRIALSKNNFTGPIPTELGMLSMLTSLSLTYNLLTGTIPSELGLLPGLRSLSLNDNRLTGPIPNELGNMTFLTRLWLDLRNNLLTGTIPVWLNQTLKMDVTGNKLTGV